MRIAVEVLLVAKFIIQSCCDMRSFYLVASAFLNFLIFARSRHLIFRLEFQARRLNLHLISTAAYDPRLKYAKNLFSKRRKSLSQIVLNARLKLPADRAYRSPL